MVVVVVIVMMMTICWLVLVMVKRCQRDETNVHPSGATEAWPHLKQRDVVWNKMAHNIRAQHRHEDTYCE